MSWFWARIPCRKVNKRLRAPKARAEKIYAIFDRKARLCQLRSPRFPKLRYALADGFILSTPPVYQRKQTFASAEGWRGENLRDFLSRRTVFGSHHLVFSRCAEHTLSWMSWFKTSLAHDRKWMFTSAEGASGENLSDFRSKIMKYTQFLALIISFF